MPNIMLTESIAMELGASEPWPDDVLLFQQLEDEQILLPERALTRATEAFLRMCSLDFKMQQNPNCEQISPVPGQLPFIKAGPFVISGMDAIVDFVNKKGITLITHLDSSQRADLKAHMNLVSTVFHMAELFISWCHQETLKKVTEPRYTYPYPWPLSSLLFFLKKKEISSSLKKEGWLEKTIDEILTEVETCCQALSERLDRSPYFYGEKPTELDALVFGHISAILDSKLPDESLAEIIQEYPKLLELTNRIKTSYF